jgi:hypothetical protein
VSTQIGLILVAKKYPASGCIAELVKSLLQSRIAIQLFSFVPLGYIISRKDTGCKLVNLFRN